MAIAERRARRQADRRTAVADQQRRDRDVQAIEQVRFEKHRHSDAAAFDEDAAAAARTQHAQQLADVDAVRPLVERDDRRAADVRLAAGTSDLAQTYRVTAESSLNTL